MKFAFLNKNFRALPFELKTIFLVHFLTVIFCFFPWLSGDNVTKFRSITDSFSHTAFSGSSFLIGIFVFLLSLGITGLFFDKLFDKNKLKLPFPEKFFYAFASAEQIIFLILVWSVLFSESQGLSPAQIRFGFYSCFLLQIVGAVAVYLHFQTERQKQARRFMQHPEVKPKKEEEKEKKSSHPNLFHDQKH